MPRSLDPSVGKAEPTGGFDLRTIGALLKRRWTTWVLPPVLALVLIGIFVAEVTPRYTAETRLRLASQDALTRFDRVSLPHEPSSQLDQVAVRGQVQLITSLNIAHRAIEALHLAGNDEFDPLVKGISPLTRGLVLVGLIPDPARETADARLVQSFERKLHVAVPPGTGMAEIAFTSRDPALAARGANKVAALYLQEQAAAERGLAQGSAETLSKQITDLRAKLAEAKATRERYQRSSDLLAGPNEAVKGQSPGDLDTELSRARASQADARAKAATIRDLLNQNRAADVADVSPSPVVRQLLTQRAATQAQLMTESRTLLPEHPRVKELTAQLKEIDAALKSAGKQAAVSLDNDAKVAGQRVKDLEVALAQRKGHIGTADADKAQLAALDHAAQTLEEQIQSSTAKYDQALARRSSTATPTDAHVISSAAPPREPSFPRKLPMLIVGTLVTLALSIAWVVASEILFGRAHRRAPATARPRAPRAAASTAAAKPRVAEPVAKAVKPTAAPFRWRAGSTAGDARATAGTDFWADGAASPAASPASAAGSAPAAPAAPSTRFGLPGKRGVARDGSDVVLAPVAPRETGRPKTSDVGPRRWVKGTIAALAAFGRPASETKPTSLPTSSETPRVDFGWDAVATAPGLGAAPAEAAAETIAVVPDLDVAARIVARHVPGRGLHVVGAGIGVKPAAFDKLIALARVLAEKGRSIIVDLNASPAKLASLGAREDGQAVVARLDGLSELLAGEASFAEVIHRDHQTRLHFIPTGRKEADFRDFDLILDALTETYDFIVLLTPAFPQSEIAKVMAPYADLVVLSSADAADFAVLEALEGELSAAGAREVLVAGAATPGDRSARVFA